MKGLGTVKQVMRQIYMNVARACLDCMDALWRHYSTYGVIHAMRMYIVPRTQCRVHHPSSKSYRRDEPERPRTHGWLNMRTRQTAGSITLIDLFFTHSYRRADMVMMLHAYVGAAFACRATLRRRARPTVSVERDSKADAARAVSFLSLLEPLP